MANDNGRVLSPAALWIVRLGLLATVVGGGWFLFFKKDAPPAPQNPAAQQQQLQQVQAPSENAQTIVGRVRIGGSTGGGTISSAVGPAIRAKYKGVIVTPVPQIHGSSAGIKAVSDGTLDMAISSRLLTEHEKSAGLKEAFLASVPIALVTGKGSPITDVTTEQLRQLLTATPTQINGQDVRLLVRQGSGTTDSLAAAMQVQVGSGATVEVIPDSKTEMIRRAQVGSGSAKIGYAILPHVDRQQSAQILSVDGVLPQDPGYPLYLTLSLVYRDDTPANQAVASFIQSAEGQVVVQSAMAAAQ
jgi:phosphate transport system substrate-binding protein